MTMKTRRLISPRDFEKLSAYLDGQLSPKEFSRLQARLQEDQQMQIALEELGRTRAALRSLSTLRAPRNFTLTRKMVGERAPVRRSAYPIFGFASLAASLLLVLVFVADRLNLVQTAQVSALNSAVQATQMEQVVQTLVVESLAAEGVSAQEEALPEGEALLAPAEASEESMRVMESPAEESYDALTLPYPEPTLLAMSEAMEEEIVPPSPDLTEEPSVSLAMTGVITETSIPNVSVVTATEILGIGGGGPPPTTSTPDLSELQASSTPEPSPEPTETVSMLAEPAQMKAVPSELPAEQPTATQIPDLPPSRLPSRTLITVVEIILALVAGGSALVFIYLYRKSN